MPIFSLPARYGIGTIGKEAFRFIDFLEAAGQSYWQILPLNPTNYGDSPYQSFSSFAGNPYFIDLELLIDEKLLTVSQAEAADFGDNPRKIDYGKLYENRLSLLKLAFENFKPNKEFNRFCSENAFWLEDYSLFMALKNANGGAAFHTWDKNIAEYEKSALNKARATYKSDIGFYKFLQFKFFEQWKALKEYANKKGIKIIGDIPIYVAYDSADVWADKSQFLIDENLKLTKVAGCPPDAFSEDGQLWGNPLYNWPKMKSEGYAWWKRRIAHAFGLYDVVRIDHFRAFEAFYAIPATDNTAKNGKWIKGPGIGFFKELKAEFGENLPIIAEDLGFLTPAVKKLLKATGFPGMKVLQFAFDSREDSDYLPHNYNKNCVVYTGTHDNDTIIGWAESVAKSDLKFALAYLNAEAGNNFNWAMIKAAMMSAADTAILMMPDFLGLGSEARINTPSTTENNWQWRIDSTCINDWLAGIIKENTIIYRRLPKKEEE